jgi:hypothetical protein
MPFSFSSFLLFIPVYLFYINLNNEQGYINNGSKKFIPKFLWSILGVLTILVTYEELRKNFVRYSDFSKISDVIPHAQTLYNRFAHGQFPYSPIVFGTYTLDPIYLPFHWLPIYFSQLWHFDVRWTGWGILAIMAGVYGWSVKSIVDNKVSLALALICPSLVLWAYILWVKGELSITYEIIIGAYYLLLGAGLMTRNYWIIGAGIVGCLLSRFTLLFWLPFFAFVVYKDVSLRKNILFWSGVTLRHCHFFYHTLLFKRPWFHYQGYEIL